MLAQFKLLGVPGKKIMRSFSFRGSRELKKSMRSFNYQGISEVPKINTFSSRGFQPTVMTKSTIDLIAILCSPPFFAIQ